MTRPATFADGTTYCDAGREITRRLFSWYHKDDGTYCAQYSLELHQVSDAVVSGHWPSPGLQCTDEAPKRPINEMDLLGLAAGAFLRGREAAREAIRTSRQDASGRYNVCETYE